VSISTESEISGTHSIYFNRGVAASQAYANRFQNRKPDDVPSREAYKWLSRGLEEAILKYISKAKDDRFALRAAVYEFNYHPVLKKFKEASENGADVQIVYDARKKNPREATEKAINEVGIQHLVTPRTATKSYISHNKFIVLLKDNQPISVWTGSTNFTKGGIFGQSNVGHIVRDKAVAQRYLDYWHQLKANKTAGEVRLWTEENPIDPVGPPSPNSIMTLFSPRKTLSVLEWYAEQLNDAKQTVALTAAFGVNPVLAEVLGQDKEYLRYLLLETEGDNRQIFGADRDVQIAVGSLLSGDALYSWTRETLSGFNQWVKYIHTKYMLIDPLSDNPITITGSANFSAASTKKNDENMLVISSDKRVAHIYFGEFMRLFSHYYFRALIQKQKGEEVEAPAKLFLNPKPSWTNPYYRSGNLRFKRRLLFSGNA
jgi:phosphatidylserine/phosphatidylglycerophosphate/cardiolipin synthase-like enzyme